MPQIPSRYQDRPGAYIGIDPGKNGGIVLLSRIGNVWHWSMPESELDLWKVFLQIQTLSAKTTVHAMIEHVTASPQGGVTSMFTFGFGYGRLRLALVASGLSHELIRPQVWQEALNIPPRKKGKRGEGEGPKIGFRRVGGESDKDWKERLRVKAQQIYPNLEVWSGTKKSQYAISDALLIAHYCRRLHLYKDQTDA